MNDSVRNFLFPRLTRGFIARVAILAIATFAVCRYWLRPVYIVGMSMLPTYSSHSVNVVNMLAYRSSPPKRGDVVVLRYGGTERMLLKRAIAFEGETVEFRGGKCLVNGSEIDEPYIKLPCDWNARPKTVQPGRVYVMGDNLSVPLEVHVGGEISVSRIEGRPLW